MRLEAVKSAQWILYTVLNIIKMPAQQKANNKSFTNLHFSTATKNVTESITDTEKWK